MVNLNVGMPLLNDKNKTRQISLFCLEIISTIFW
jgi:hypothetical protein